MSNLKANLIYISFSLKSFPTSMETNDVLERNYQTVYKPIAKLLYSHPSIRFSFSFSGNQLSYLKRKHSEFIAIIKELIEKGQVEILGGGYYEPVMPLLYPVDRNGQIDMLSAEIRQATGKRPRGLSLFGDCWDSGLVNSMQTCGIEYVLLESSLVHTNKHKFLPLIMSDLGKSVEIFPYYDNLLPDSQIEIDEYIKSIIKTVEKAEKKDTYFQFKPDRIVNLNFSHEDITKLYEAKWFEKLNDYLENQEEKTIDTILTQTYRKSEMVKVPAYIPAGINASIAKWVERAYTEVELKQDKSKNVFDFMETYPQSRSLYNRILYVSMLVNQYKNDKMRKKDAREHLWQAQNGTGLLCSPKGVFSNSKYRQRCYKYLMEAEKILREDGKFKEQITCFDYDGDGLNEYICRMQNYFAYISLKSGAIQELEILKNTGNYVDNLSRVSEYDGYSDDYKRGLFIDHIFTQEQFDQYKMGKPAGNGIFSKIQYSVQKYSQSHFELSLFAYATFPTTKQQIYLRKKYIINSTGMTIQYILKNESNSTLKVIFAVENNFAHTNFDADNITYYSLEAANSENKVLISTDKSSYEQKDLVDTLQQIDTVRLTDNESGVSFAFEPNENCNFCFQPMVFNRPSYNTNGIETVPVHMTFVQTLFWNINIEPGMETEKTINFSITNVKKEKRKSNL